MQYVRAYSRIISLVLVTPIIFSLFLPSLILKIVGINNDTWRNKVLTLWGKTCSRIVGLRITVEGEKPATPFFLVSNHLSYTDVFVLLSTVDGVFVAKSDVRGWPFLGWMMDVIGILFINRESRTDVKRVNELIRKTLRPNQGIILFPEATTSNGDSILPFKASLLAYPAEQEFAVNYASIRYTSGDEDKSEREYIHWWGDMTFFTHLLQLLSMQKFYATVTFGESKVHEEDRKKLATELYSRVKSQYLRTTE